MKAIQPYHRVFAEIHIDHIIHNLKAIQSYVGLDTQIMLVIKADAYGHGAIPIAKALKSVKLDYIGVATVQEAIALREEGVMAPILVLGYTPKIYYRDLIAHDITQTIYQKEMVEALSQEALNLGKQAKVHIKIDTGMNRIGFKPDADAFCYIQSIKALAGIHLEGIFTHFSKADEPLKTFTQEQIKVFCGFLETLKSKDISFPLVHAANSAGMLGFKEAHLNLVRVGIALYGLYPSEHMVTEGVVLKPALSLKSHVIQVKSIAAGDYVSYGGTYQARSTMRVATIPVGYGDGYPRALSNQGYVLIRGQKAPIIGRVCMDMFMVDVSHIPVVEVDDLVVLIGKDGDAVIHVSDLAAMRDTIHYEVLCQLGKRIPRVYYQNGAIIDTVDYF